MIRILSFDGFGLEGPAYTASFVATNQAMGRSAEPVVLPVVGGFPRAEGSEHASNSFQVRVVVAGVDVVEAADTLKAAFRAGRRGQLIVEVDGDLRQRAVTVEGAQPFAGAPRQFIVSFLAADPRWRSVTETVVDEEVETDGQQWTVTNPGNAVVDDAVITFKPHTQKAGADSQLYRRYAVMANRAPRPLPDWPVDLTNGGIDHAALVSAGKSQADGDDVLVLVDGTEEPRYFGEHSSTDPNSATTKVWATPRWSAARTANLLVDITDSAPADGESLPVRRGQLRDWPQRGAVVNPATHEVIHYDGIPTEGAEAYSAFLNIRRGVWGSAAASGTAGQLLLHAEHKLELVYGWLNAPAPEARPDLKPMLNLASNTLTNIRHEWADFFDVTYPTRPGQWSLAREERDTQTHFMFLAPGSPASSLQWTYQYGSAPAGQLSFNVARRDFPVGTSGATGQISVGYDIDTTLAAEVIGTAEDGTEVIATILRGAAAGTYTSAAALTNKLQSVALYARSHVLLSTPEVVGAPLDGGTYTAGQWAATNSAGTESQILRNRSSATLSAYGVMALWSVTSGSPVANTNMFLVGDDGGSPLVVASLGGVQVPAADLGAAAAWVGGLFSPVAPGMIAAGQAVHVYGTVSATTHGPYAWTWLPVMYEDDFPFLGARVLGDGEIDPDARANLGDQVEFDNAVILLDSAGVPYFSLKAEQPCYWANHTLRNLTTGQRLRFNLYISPGDEVEVDCGNRTVTNLTTGEEGLLYGVEPGEERFFDFASGANQLQWDEAGVAGVDVEVRLRGAYE